MMAPAFVLAHPTAAALICFLLVFLLSTGISLLATWFLHTKEDRDLIERLQRDGVIRLRESDPQGQAIAKRMIDGRPFPRGQNTGGRLG